MGKERRKFSAEFKLDTVLEGIRGEKSIAEICRERDITDSLHYKWRDVFKVHPLGTGLSHPSRVRGRTGR